MILRVGFPISDREPPATPRRSVDEVLDADDAATSGARHSRKDHSPVGGF